MACFIIGAGSFYGLPVSVQRTDMVIAADGGLKHTRKLGIEPNEIIGDFDSLGFTPPGAEIFPVEKDDTDAMLAVRRGLELGYREFLLYGSLDGPGLTTPWPISRRCNSSPTGAPWATLWATGRSSPSSKTAALPSRRG